MLRRDFFRAAVSVGVAPKLLLSQQTANPAPPPPAPVPWTLGLNPKTPLPRTQVADDVAQSEVRFFSPLQMATLSRLAEVLVPPMGDKPGAIEAGTPLFLDFLIGSSPQARRHVYTAGLDWLEAESQRKFKLPFAKLDDAQADALLKPWLRTWMTDHPPNEAHTDFVNIAHHDIRTATVNSKGWTDVPPAGGQERAEVALYWSPIEPDLHVESIGHVPSSRSMAAPKAEHQSGSYPR